MKPRGYLFLALGLLCWLAAFLLTAREISRFRAAQAFLPAGTVVAGVPVGGLRQDAARERLELAYTQTPVELLIDGAPVQVSPADLGQRFDAAALLERARPTITDAAALFDRTGQTRADAAAFWDFLLARPEPAVEVQAECSVDSAQMTGWLERELLPRYSLPPTPARIAPGEVAFQPGTPGVTLDLQAALPALAAALCDPARPTVAISSTPQPAPRPTASQLALGLEALVQASGFDGVVEVYAQDIATGAEINFAYASQQPVEPGIAFTAASTIKIPVLVSAYRRAEALDPAVRQALVEMIDLSDNNSTDVVMQSILDPNIAPVQVTEDARSLGLQNTFLAGFFYPGAPLLDRYSTPANARADVTTEPDIYNQTTPAEMGRLIAAIQRCAANGSGLLTETFPNQITQAECGEMLALLQANRKGILIEAGLPEGAVMGHKYGWVTDPADGLMHQASDAAVVQTPGGPFVLAVYLYHPDQLQWEPAVQLNAWLAALMVNYYQPAGAAQ